MHCNNSIWYLISYSQKIILNKDNEITIDLYADNKGETGYQCDLNIRTPDKIELTQNSWRTFENQTYSLSFASKLETSKQVFLFYWYFFWLEISKQV